MVLMADRWVRLAGVHRVREHPNLLRRRRHRGEIG